MSGVLNFVTKLAWETCGRRFRRGRRPAPNSLVTYLARDPPAHPYKVTWNDKISLPRCMRMLEWRACFEVRISKSRHRDLRFPFQRLTFIVAASGNDGMLPIHCQHQAVDARPDA